MSGRKKRVASPKPLHLAIHGAAGRMGRRILALALRDARFRVTTLLERPGHEALGLDGGVLAGSPPLGVAVRDGWNGGADILVDFSSPEGSRSIVVRCAALGVPAVLGTTGLGSSSERAIARASRRIAVLAAPNMSLGANLLFLLAAQAARALDPAADVEIHEVHHASKRDAPSGTALRLVEAVNAARGKAPRAGLRLARAGADVLRVPGEIGVHALRLADAVGEHTASFAWAGERIELTHRATDRDVFARGALEAAYRLASRRPGRYAFADLFA